jgi:hypothetical protein
MNREVLDAALIAMGQAPGNPNLIYPNTVIQIGIPAKGGYAIPYETARWYTLPHAMLGEKLRFTFTNLHAWSGMWVAGAREIRVGNVGKVPVVGKNVLDMAPTPSGKGYWIFGSDGMVFSYGDAGKYGNKGGTSLPGRIVGGAGTPSGKGYWLLCSNGTVYTFGDAHNYGNFSTSALTGPMVAFRRRSTGDGYWAPSSDITVGVKGAATYFGTGATTIPAGTQIVDMAVKFDNSGYWLLDSNGTVFACGSVLNHGNGDTSHKWVGIESTASGNGYWLAANDGFVAHFGDAVAHGGPPHGTLTGPITGIKRNPQGGGYLQLWHLRVLRQSAQELHLQQSR